MKDTLIKNVKDKVKRKIRAQQRTGRLISGFLLTISKWDYSNFFLLRWVSKLIVFPIYFLLKDEFYKFVIFAKQTHVDVTQKSDGFTRFFPKSFLLKVITGGKAVSIQEYRAYMSTVRYSADMQYEWSRRFIEVGRLDLAREGFIELYRRKVDRLAPEKQLKLLRQLGAVCFMLGNNNEANYYWGLGGKLRRAFYKPNTPKKYRILGPSWFVAIGHIAMLDYYFKFRKLYDEEGIRIVASVDEGQIPVIDLFNKFAEMGISVLSADEIESDYNKWAQTHYAPSWKQLSLTEKAALIDDFWEYDFPDGEILGYAHAAARLQQEWESKKLPNLLELYQAEQDWVRDYLVNLGMPKDAWFVCLHVREGGFHKNWNAVYPSMRDADIMDYCGAIEMITKAGGWVLRMGDPSMKALPEMENVIDYAHSELKTAIADVLLVASCKFYLGTNSGFATIAAIYGIPCVLTNWVPLGWPLWPKQDIMVPKVFKNMVTSQLLSFEEVYQNNLAFIQNRSDLPDWIEIISNTSEEIVSATLEMLQQSHLTQFQQFTTSEECQAYQRKYEIMAKKYGAFTGSQFSKSFIQSHTDLFKTLEKQPFTIEEAALNYGTNS